MYRGAAATYSISAYWGLSGSDPNGTFVKKRKRTWHGKAVLKTALREIVELPDPCAQHSFRILAIDELPRDPSRGATFEYRARYSASPAGSGASFENPLDWQAPAAVRLDHRSHWARVQQCRYQAVR